jgi:hypothetical protein
MTVVLVYLFCQWPSLGCIEVRHYRRTMSQCKKDSTKLKDFSARCFYTLKT